MTPEELAELASFKNTCKGLSAHNTAKALNRLSPGIDWRGCSKSRLAQGWATRKGTSPIEFGALKNKTDADLRAAIVAIDHNHTASWNKP